MDAIDQVIRRLSLRDLRIFMRVIEHRNLAKAASSLSISRPVVSKSIAHLEQMLGVRLLDRRPQGTEPTAYGEALIKRATAAFDELRQGVGELKHLADPGTGEIRIGASEYMAAGLIPKAIAHVSHQHANVRFNVELADPIGELRERRIEFVVKRMLSPQLDSDLSAEPLFHERVFIAAGAASRWAGRRKVALEDLAREPWILAPPEIVEGSPIVEAFRARRLTMPQTTVLGLSLPLRNGLLATGRFLTIVPGSVLRFGSEKTLLKPLPIALARWPQPVAIITLKGRTLSPVASSFLERLRKLAAELA